MLVFNGILGTLINFCFAIRNAYFVWLSERSPSHFQGFFSIVRILFDFATYLSKMNTETKAVQQLG